MPLKQRVHHVIICASSTFLWAPLRSAGFLRVSIHCERLRVTVFVFFSHPFRLRVLRFLFKVYFLLSLIRYYVFCCCFRVLLNVQSVKMLTDYSLNELRTMDFLDSKKHGSFFIMFYIRCDRWIEWNPFFMISHIVNYNKFIGCNPFWLGASKKKDQSNEAMKLMLDWWWKRKDFWSYVIKCNSKIGFSAHSLVEGVKQLIELCLMIVRQKKNQIVSKCKATQQRYQQCF